MARKPKIALIVTGGTIDTLGEDRLDLAEYARHRRWLTPGELVVSIPELSTLAQIVPVQLPRFGVSGMAITDWVQLHDAIVQAVTDGADGVVVTQGTNYVEENAYFLALALKVACPVVLTAAMRPASGMSSDGALNLINAVRVAMTADAVEHGVTVVLNDEIHAARDVVKAHTHALDAFQSPMHGPLGTICPDGHVAFYRRGLRQHTRDTPFQVQHIAAADWQRVDIIPSYYGGDGALVDAAVQCGARGLVSAGFGAGRAGPGYDQAFDRAIAQGVCVVQASRAQGRVLVYSGLSERGIIAADDLTPWKARILLQLALTQTTRAAEIQEMFQRY